MHKYELIIYWSEEDGLYVAEVPELPGCMADGNTYDEAMKNAQVVLTNGSKRQRLKAGRFLRRREG